MEQKVKELHTKPESEEIGIQTDTVKFVCEEHGTQTDVDTNCSDVDGSAMTEKMSLLPEKSAHETTDNKEDCQTDNNTCLSTG